MRTLNRISRVSHHPQSHRGPRIHLSVHLPPIEKHHRRCCAFPIPLFAPLPVSITRVSRCGQTTANSRNSLRARIPSRILSNVILALPKNSYERAPSSHRINLCLDFAHAFPPALHIPRVCRRLFLISLYSALYILVETREDLRKFSFYTTCIESPVITFNHSKKKYYTLK